MCRGRPGQPHCGQCHRDAGEEPPARREAGPGGLLAVRLLRTLYLIMIRFTILRIIDSSTLRIFDHENWPNISRKTLAKLVKRETLRLLDRNILRLDSEFSFLSSTEGQLYRALLVWAEHWIRAGKYQSLEEAIAEFIPEIEFEHMGYYFPQCSVKKQS